MFLFLYKEISKKFLFLAIVLFVMSFPTLLRASETRALFTQSQESVDINEEVIVEDLLIPRIESQTFFDPEIWYTTKDGLFTWQLPIAVTAVAVEIATSSDNRPNNNPNSIYETPISEFLITPDLVGEGVQYLSLRFRVDKKWGEILNYPILIDTQAPELLEIKTTLAGTGFPTLNFATTDKTSGIDYYLLTINKGEVLRLTQRQAEKGYTLSELENGIYEVEVTVFDRAGNSTTDYTTIPVTAGWVKSVPKVAKSFADYLTPTNLAILALLVVIVCLIIIMCLERKYIDLKETQILLETEEAREQTVKIFSALRDEIYEQINNINKKKRLSKNEKQAVEGLSQALEVSQALISKEINDVRKIL